MRIRDIMTKNICSVAESDPISEIAADMKKFDIGFVPVEDGDGNLTGIITDRDIVLRGINAGTPPENVYAADIMSRNIVSISPDHSPTEAARMMSRARVRRLPVTENNKIVGVVSLGDLSRAKNLFSETAAAFCDICEPDGENNSEKQPEK